MASRGQSESLVSLRQSIGPQNQRKLDQGHAEPSGAEEAFRAHALLGVEHDGADAVAIAHGDSESVQQRLPLERGWPKQLLQRQSRG